MLNVRGTLEEGGMASRGPLGDVFEVRVVKCPFCDWGHSWSGPPAAEDPGPLRLAAHVRDRHPGEAWPQREPADRERRE